MRVEFSTEVVDFNQYSFTLAFDPHRPRIHT